MSDVAFKKTSWIAKTLSRPKVILSSKILSAVCLILPAFLIATNLSMILFSIQPMYVVSNSMQPTFSKGDLILVANEPNGVAVDDIIIYEADWLQKKAVSHRVVEINDNMIVAKGDANVSYDPPFDKSKIQGEVFAIIPSLGFIFSRWLLVPLCLLGIVMVSVNDYGTKILEENKAH